MDWWTLGYIIILAIVINFTYRKGVRAGIKHSILVLDLDSIQVNKLNKELKKDNITLTKEILN